LSNNNKKKKDFNSNIIYKGIANKNISENDNSNEKSRFQYKSNLYNRNTNRFEPNKNMLSYSIDNILMKNFDKNQQNFMNSRNKASNENKFISEKKNNISSLYSKNRNNYNIFNDEDNIISDTGYIKNRKNDIVNKDSNYLVNKKYYDSKNFIKNFRKFTNFSDNKTNRRSEINNYNHNDDFNYKITNNSFGSDLKIEKIELLNMNRINEEKFKNKNIENKIENEFDYTSINERLIDEKNNIENINNKSIKNFSFKKYDYKKSNILNSDNNNSSISDLNYEEIKNIDKNFAKTKDISNKNNYKEEKIKFNSILKNIRLSKDSDSNFGNLGIEGLDGIYPLYKNDIKTKLSHFSNNLFDNNFITNSKNSYSDTNNIFNEIIKEKLTIDDKHKENENFNNKIINSRQKIIVRNDQVKIISNVKKRKENNLMNSIKNIAQNKVEITDNKIRITSSSTNFKIDSNKLNNSVCKCIDSKDDNNLQINMNDTKKKNFVVNENNHDSKKMGKFLDLNYLYNLTKKSSSIADKKIKLDFSSKKMDQNNLTSIKINETENFKCFSNDFKNKYDTYYNPHSTKNINYTKKIDLENIHENIFLNLNNSTTNLKKIIKHHVNDSKKTIENHNIFNKIFYVSDLNINKNYKDLENPIRLNLNKNKEDIFEDHTGEKTDKNLNNIMKIGKEKIDKKFSHYDMFTNNLSLSNIEDVNEKSEEIKENERMVKEKKENIKISDIFRIFHDILLNFNCIKDKIFRISNHMQQLELTSDTIKDQISKNYSHLHNKIFQNLNSLGDNIIGINSKNLKYSKRLIPNIIDNSKKICLFDIKLQKFEIKEFEYLTIKLNTSTNIDHDGSDLIFLSGGKVNNSINFFKNNEENYADFSGNVISIFLILRWSTKAIELNSQLLRKRSYHSSLFFNNKLYIIGGASSGNQILKECECYNIIQKQWELLPNLNYARCNSGLCIYNDEYLYSFNGWNTKDHFLDSIEFIRLGDFYKNNWTAFKPEDPGLSWEGFAFCSAAVVAENKILIFGGYRNDLYLNHTKDNNTDKTNQINLHNIDKNIYCNSFKEREFENKTYFLDPIKKNVFRGKDLVKGSVFYNNSLFYENKIYAVDNKNEDRKMFGVHVYDINNNIWKYYQGPQ